MLHKETLCLYVLAKDCDMGELHKGNINAVQYSDDDGGGGGGEVAVCQSFQSSIHNNM